MCDWMVTPSVIVDEARLRRNVERMQQLADAHGVQLRPHAKTHKSVEVAALQLSAGASGLTVAKPSEALMYLHSGLAALKSVLVAYPVVQTAKVSQLLVAAKQFDVEVRITVDSVNGVDAVEEAANACDYVVKVLLHIDVGYHRVGLEEGDPRILEFARRIAKSPKLEFIGLLSHAGARLECCWGPVASILSQLHSVTTHVVVRRRTRVLVQHGGAVRRDRGDGAQHSRPYQDRAGGGVRPTAS